MAGSLWGYRIGGAMLVWLLAVLVAMDVGLLLAGRDADGLESLAAALNGAMWGTLLGVAAGVGFAVLPRPEARLHRALVLVGLALASVLALALQEFLD